MDTENWLICPVCNSKTRIRLREDTLLENFPLVCPKCKQETFIMMDGKVMEITPKFNGGHPDPTGSQDSWAPPVYRTVGLLRFIFCRMIL